VPPRPLDELRVENFLPSVQTLHVGPPVEALCHLFPVLALVLHDKRSQPLVLLLGPFALALFTDFRGLDGGVVRKHAARQHALGGHYDCLPALSRCRRDLAAGHAAACRAAPRPVRPRVPEGDTKPNSMRKGAIWSPAGPHVAGTAVPAAPACGPGSTHQPQHLSAVGSSRPHGAATAPVDGTVSRCLPRRTRCWVVGDVPTHPPRPQPRTQITRATEPCSRAQHRTPSGVAPSLHPSLMPEAAGHSSHEEKLRNCLETPTGNVFSWFVFAPRSNTRRQVVTSTSLVATAVLLLQRSCYECTSPAQS